MAKAYVPDPVYHHERDFIGYGEESLNPHWPNDAKIAVSFVINYEEVPRSPPSPLQPTKPPPRAASAPSSTATVSRRAT